MNISSAASSLLFDKSNRDSTCSYYMYLSRRSN